MKNSCRYLLVFGIVYTLGIWGFSYYYFNSQVKKMEALFDLTNKVRQTDKDHMIYLRQAADLLGKGFYHNNWKAATVCLSMGMYYLDMGQYELAIPWLHMDEKLNNKGLFQYMEIRTFENLGEAYWKIHSHEMAEHYFNKAQTGLLTHDQSNYDDLDRSIFYRKFGIFKYENEEYQEALILLQKSREYLSLTSEFSDSHKNVLHGYTALCISYCYLELNDLVSALDYCKQAENYFTDGKKFNRYASNLYILFSRIYDKEGNVSQAKSSLKSAGEYLDYANHVTFDRYNELLNKSP